MIGRKRLETKTSTGNDYDTMFKSVRGLAENICALNQQAVKEYAPVVEDIIDTHNQHVRHIERTLDGLLDFCGYAPALQLYRRLCRYYWDIAPAATASYVNAYREIWDSDVSSPGNVEHQLGENKKNMPSWSLAIPGSRRKSVATSKK